MFKCSYRLSILLLICFASHTKGQDIDSLIPYRQGKQWGYANPDAKVIVPCTYDRCYPFAQLRACVIRDGKMGFINRYGYPLIPLDYEVYSNEAVFFDAEGLALIAQTDSLGKQRFGMLGLDGHVVIPLKFKHPFSFHEKRASIKTKHGWYFIMQNGEPLNYTFYEAVGDFQQKRARIKKDNFWGFIGINGQEVIGCQYDFAGDFSEGLAAVNKGDVWGFIDSLGQERIPMIYEKVMNFQCGLAPVLYQEPQSMFDPQSGQFRLDKTIKEARWGFINDENEVVIDFQYQAVSHFYDGFAAVMHKGHWQVIDTTGKAINQQYYQKVLPFNEGLAAVKQHGHYGYIDKTGRQLIPCRYDIARSFHQGRAVVGLYKTEKTQKTLYYGIIDQSGEVILSIDYQKIKDYKNGLALVRKGATEFYVDRSGRIFYSENQ